MRTCNCNGIRCTKCTWKCTVTFVLIAGLVLSVLSGSAIQLSAQDQADTQGAQDQADTQGAQDQADTQGAQVDKTFDDMFADVAKDVPGFGGMFFEGKTVKVYLTDPTQQQASVQAATAVLGTESTGGGEIQVLKGEYDFLQLKEWYDGIGGVFAIPGVVFTDIDEKENRLTIGVDEARQISAVEEELTRLNIPRAAVNIVETDPIVPVVTLQNFHRPISGGLQINFPGFLCTLGFNGIRLGVSGFVTNSHCTTTQGGVESTPYGQPTLANPIGTEIADPTYNVSKCTIIQQILGFVCRFADSSFAQRTSGVTANRGLIEKPTGQGSLTLSGVHFRITTEGASLVGQTLHKVGRTTGWTSGVVTNTCVDTQQSGSNKIIRCQNFVSAGGVIVLPGDSGSPVFRRTNSPLPNDVQLRGELWGSTAGGTVFVFSPINNIQRSNELGPITNCAPGFAC